jgi:glycosyltransferase involved in cell wall biosynthesis
MVALTLLMTVKNEENALKRALPSIAPFLSSYCIGVDNKTTDDTKGVISKIMEEHEVPGITFDSPWHESFADARNQVLMMAEGLTPEVSSHCIWMDADHTFSFSPNNDWESFTKVLESAQPMCHVTIRNGDFNHRLPWLITRDSDGKLPYLWKGVLHEFQQYEGKSRVLDTSLAESVPITLHHYYDGNARPKGKLLYSRDVEMLLNALQHESDEGMIARYVFYLANSYKDAGDKKNATIWYRVRCMMGWWDQEIYESLLSIGKMNEDLEAFKRAIEVCPTRPDAYYHALWFARHKENHRWMREIIGVYEEKFGEPTEERPFSNQGGLFVDDAKLWKVDDELSQAYYWAKENKEMAMLHSNRALIDCNSPGNKKRITGNQSFFE